MREGSTNIDYLDEFVFLADSLSFKRTAEHFYVSRSVISRHMASLEETLGVRLLQRDSHGVELTRAGEVFYRDAQTVLRGWEAAVERVRGVRDGVATLVRIGYLRNAARPVLVRFLRYMRQRHPDVQISLACMEYEELNRALLEHAVDVALAINVSPALSRSYRCTPVYQDRFFAVCALDNPLARHSEGLSIEDLRGKKLLFPGSYMYSGLSALVETLVDEQALSVAQSYYQDLDMLNLKVQTEGYVAFSSGMNNSVFSGEVVVLPVRDVDTSFSVSAFYHDSFVGSSYEACCEGFEYCRKSIQEQGMPVADAAHARVEADL